MTTAGLRRLLAALLILGTAGLLLDLLLLGHTESFTQQIPFGVMLAGLVLVAAAELHPTTNVIRALQAVMVLFVVAGVLGLVLHYKGNVEFELERDLWSPIDINTASAVEILLIPGVGPRMRREFEEYRPYRSMEQFRREMGKYVDDKEVARLESYIVIR